MNEDRIPVMPPYMDDYTWAARKAERIRRAKIRRIRNRAALLIVGAACIGTVVNSCSKEAKETAAAEAEATNPPTITINALTIQTKYPEELIHDTPTLLQGVVDLPLEYQLKLYALCDSDPERFCALMTIAYLESRFQIYEIGDSGNSYGMFQINLPAQADRIQALGFCNEEMLDPFKSAEVALDYIDWIIGQMGVTDYDSDLFYMAYNQGWWGATSDIDAGYTSSSYSREAIQTWNSYMEAIDQ